MASFFVSTGELSAAFAPAVERMDIVMHFIVVLRCLEYQIFAMGVTDEPGTVFENLLDDEVRNNIGLKCRQH